MTETKMGRPVVVVTVTYNTGPLIALLLWSLHRFVGGDVTRMVVVDNGSDDDTAPLLAAAREGGLCDVITNDVNRGHGPALNQALAQVAAPAWVWVLDSDCVVARSDAVAAATSAADRAGAAVTGEAAWNEWAGTERFGVYSLLLDRTAVGDDPFVDGGEPSGVLQERGVASLDFPFTKDGHVIHLGRASIAEVRRRGQTEHPLWDWAQDHHAPHFQLVPGAEHAYRSLVTEFEQALRGPLTPNALVRACRGA